MTREEELQQAVDNFSEAHKYGGDTKVNYTDAPFLYINKTHSISHGRDMCIFTEHEYREISVEEILSLELTEPNYRPFKNKEECWNEMLKHQPFAWIKHKTTHLYQDCRCVGINNIFGISFNEAFNDYVFADEKPVGIKRRLS